MIDSGSARRDESNDMCFEAGRRFVPEIASAHVQCDKTHIIRFVSTSRTRIRQLRIDSDSARRDESNDMCFEAGRRFVPEIASAHAQCDETHIIRFVSTSRTRIRQLRIDWLRSVRDIAVFLLRMRSNCDCATAHAQTKTPISRRDLNQSMRR